ncbi:hypothetical protein IU433_17170 [Nocardia puris]|uniref:hypothetical protein n=1 Tax=Nocardia puris TaxID=208602 RepID=UPI001895548C|nr:hypothetical protein [Nocardia puris]MBF6460764.1 hypothetical protein [Nocardia puris]
MTTVFLAVCALVSAVALVIFVRPWLAGAIDDDREDFATVARRLDHEQGPPSPMSRAAAEMAYRLHRGCDPVECAHLRVARTILTFSAPKRRERR